MVVEILAWTAIGFYLYHRKYRCIKKPNKL